VDHFFKAFNASSFGYPLKGSTLGFPFSPFSADFYSFYADLSSRFPFSRLGYFSF
jgi:hypothetical protein